uniref:Uncharacterized protein n=1 Tax=Tabanus bromius TaxID=304241 RepID=A0A0K8TR57_TABBR
MEGTTSHILGSMCNGEIQIERLQQCDLEDAIKVLDTFFANESICNATEINLPENEESREELRDLCREVSTDNVSVVARHLPTNRIVSVAFNKLQTAPATGEKPYFEEFRDRRCRTKNAIALMDFMIIVDAEFDLLDTYNTDSSFEITFLATLAEFGGKSIGRTICEYSIELAKDLGSGHKTDLIPEKYRDKRPQIATAIFSSRFSQRIGELLGFEFINTVPYTKFSFNGKLYSEVINPMHPYFVLAVKKLF